MRIFGLTVTRDAPTSEEKSLAPVSTTGGGVGGWWPIIRESFPGAWQRNIEIDRNSVLTFHAVYACTTLIASDVAKLRIKLVQQDAAGVWGETTSPAYSPVLRKPNETQNRIQFVESWVLSKLLRGNTYVLKERDNRNVVTGLYVLHPDRVRPLVSDDGAVFYQVDQDNLAGVRTQITVPAREMIHDRWNCLYHPLVGVSPIFASGLAATQGLRIQEGSTRFFTNDSTPGGVLTAPGRVSEDTAKRLKETWEAGHGGLRRGGLAVLGDGLKYEKITITAQDAQLIEQLKWSAEVVCSAFHVPPYKIGLGALPTYNNVQALNTEYYSQCLQVLIEAFELCLDEGLEVGLGLGTEFDLQNLLRMDSVTQIQVLKEAVGAGLMSPDEGRAVLDLGAVPGGGTPYLQQQNYSLAALSKRDAQADPFATAARPAPAPAPEPKPDPAAAADSAAKAALVEILKGLAA
jgi:HK97 family phage portal protein